MPVKASDREVFTVIDGGHEKRALAQSSVRQEVLMISGWRWETVHLLAVVAVG